MTKAEKLMNSNPFEIALTSSALDGKADTYIAEFKPGATNPLHIKDKHYNPLFQRIRRFLRSPKNEVCISYESAVELAKFLKGLFLDEDPD